MNILVKKLIRDYVYQSETLEDIENISSIAEGEFRDAMNEHNREALQALAAPEGGVPNPIEEDEQIHFDDKAFKKIFRKLAIKCHPDKLTSDLSDREADFLKKCYENITKANDTYDWGLLLKVALELNVEIEDIPEESIENIKENIDNLKSKIEKYEASMAYQWYSLGDPRAKENYLETCASIFMKSLGKG